MGQTDWSMYQGKRVLITGHTGFKGTWLTRMLCLAGAEVTGYALQPPTKPSLWSLLQLEGEMRSVEGDVRDYDHLRRVVQETDPEFVFHLAAQPLVRESYRIPRETFETNIMGTVNLLEALRGSDRIRSILNVTTDKVYLNQEEERSFREEDPLDGYDPYSNSKSCSDLVTHSYRSSFFAERGVALSTARAGNVIGGGDFARDRIIPDCVRAAMAGDPIVLRHPESVRPFQHVLEPLAAYLTIAARQAEDGTYAGAYNVGPDREDVITTGTLAGYFQEEWGGEVSIVARPDHGPHEAGLLMLDNSKIKDVFSWHPTWGIREAVTKVVEWSKAYQAGADMLAITDQQIREFQNGSISE